MSKRCEFCGFSEPLPFKCKFCEKDFCYNHRLPESHECYGLATYKENVRKGRVYQETVRHKESIFKPLSKFISIIKSNYSLTLITIAVASFFLQSIIGRNIYFPLFALYPIDILERPWTIITHIFLHSGTFHLFFNMMFLFFFGPELEMRIGGNKFLSVFFISGLVAAIGYILWSFFGLGFPFIPAVGASGALFGVFACLSVLAPHLKIYLYFIPTKITHALILFAILDLVLIGSGDTIARSAHLSGLVAGLILGKIIKEKKMMRE